MQQRPVETHQLVIGGVGVVIRVRLCDAHGYTVGENGKKNENIKGPEDGSQGDNVSVCGFIH